MRSHCGKSWRCPLSLNRQHRPGRAGGEVGVEKFKQQMLSSVVPSVSLASLTSSPKRKPGRPSAAQSSPNRAFTWLLPAQETHHRAASRQRDGTASPLRGQNRLRAPGDFWHLEGVGSPPARQHWRLRKGNAGAVGGQSPIRGGWRDGRGACEEDAARRALGAGIWGREEGPPSSPGAVARARGLGARDNRVTSATPPSLRSTGPPPPPADRPPRRPPGVGLPSLSCGVPRFPIALHPENPKRNLGR